MLGLRDVPATPVADAPIASAAKPAASPIIVTEPSVVLDATETTPQPGLKTRPPSETAETSEPARTSELAKTSEPAPSVAVATESPIVVEARGSRPDAGAARPVYLSALQQLQAEFARAIKQVDQETPHEERTPGFLTLLGQLAGDPEGRLRRPPTAARKAMSACHNENVSAPVLVKLLESDPLLTKAVLARANSAYYSRSAKPCLVLSEAITRQGRRSVHNVLLEQSIGGLIFSAGGPWHEMVNKVWSHMVRTGPLARALAPLFDVDPEQAFALALLHDVGKLAVFDRIATLRTAHRSELDIQKPALSRALRILHEPLGGLCAIGWHLGDEAALAIARHHRDPVPSERDTLSEVIWLAERVDLAAQRKERLDVPALWRDGDLSADPGAAELVLTGSLSDSSLEPLTVS